jgi:MoaA/NifB/PqqE/SkfB family radical SAM enzyme
LPLDRILAALSLLRREGFNAVGVSGGEPLLYGELSTVLQHARKLEMITTVTTNAMLLNDQRAEMLHDGANLVAVSLDGPPDSHNHLRAHPRAFELMTQGVARLRRAGVPFGFIFTLSLHNLHELSWVADYAVAQGASLLQVHPLEEVGRATDHLQGSAPDPWNWRGPLSKWPVCRRGTRTASPCNMTWPTWRYYLPNLKEVTLWNYQLAAS